jgi:hypothetical protein
MTERVSKTVLGVTGYRLGLPLEHCTHVMPWNIALASHVLHDEMRPKRSHMECA